MEKRHFVLVHGAGQGGWCWYKVVVPLRSAGHKVTALDLAACGVNPKQVEEIRSISAYMEPLMEFMEALPEDERVILVGHSAGGIAISVAMERFPANVSVAVFVTAPMPGPDFDILTIIRQLDFGGSDSRMDCQYRYDDGPDKPPTSFIAGPKFLSSKLYNMSTPEDLSLALLLGRPCTLFPDDNEKDLLDITALTKEKYGSIPRVYIVVEGDKTTADKTQRWMIENNPVEEVKAINGADHMVMISKPKELFSCLQEVTQNY